MAVNSVAVGIAINVSGNYDQKLRNLEKGMSSFQNVQKSVEQSFERQRKAALNQAIAFGVLTIHLRKLKQMASAVFNTFGGGLIRMAKAGADFQSQTLNLKVFFGSQAETMAAKIMDISLASGIAVNDLTTIASRLGQAGLSAEQAARATDLVAHAFQTLPASERARALIQMGRAFDRVQSFNTAFNVVLSKTEEAAFNAATGSKRVEVAIAALQSRFGNINDIMEGGLNFQLSKLSSLFTILKNRIVLPALNPLTTQLRRVNLQFRQLFDLSSGSERTLKNLQKIFEALFSPVVEIAKALADLKIIPRGIQFLAEHQEFVKTAGVLLIIGSAFTAIAASATAAAFAAASFVGVFNATGLAGPIKNLLFSFTKIGNKNLFTGKGIGAKSAGFFAQRFALEKALAPKGAGKASVLLGVFNKIATIDFANLVAWVGRASVRMAGFGAIVIAVSLIFKEAFAGLSDILPKVGEGFLALGKGLFEAFSTGRVHKNILEQINNSGLRPLFNIILTSGIRVIAFFKGMSDGVSELRYVFRESFGQMGSAISEIINTVQDVLVDLGLMDQGGKTTAYTIGFILGKSLYYAASAFMFVNTWGIKPMIKGFQLVAGFIESTIGFVNVLVGALLKLVGITVGLAESMGIKNIGGTDIAEIRKAAEASGEYLSLKGTTQVINGGNKMGLTKEKGMNEEQVLNVVNNMYFEPGIIHKQNQKAIIRNSSQMSDSKVQ